MASTHTAILPMPPEMPKGTTISQILPALKYGSLLSVGQLCYHGCEAHFDAHKFTIRQNGKKMLTEKCSLGTIGKLWILDPYLSPLEQREK
jgi:hypothetical protein